MSESKKYMCKSVERKKQHTLCLPEGGETSWDVAEQHGLTLDQLRRLNPILEADGDLVLTGDRLYVRFDNS